MALIRMCDESLDTSSEAMLSRLSKLEDAVRLASFAPVRAVEPLTEPAEEPKPEAKQDEMPGKAQTDTIKKALATDTGKPKFRPIRCKMEIAEKLAMTDIPASSFLKSAKMFEDEGGNVLIKLSNDFAITMLSRPKTKEALLASLSAGLNRPVSEASVKIEKNSSEDEKQYDILDELIDD